MLVFAQTVTYTILITVIATSGILTGIHTYHDQ